MGIKLMQRRSSSCALQASQIELADLSGAEVYREWKNIDILIIIDSLKLAVIVENKIDSSEADGQRARYVFVVRERYPRHEILPVLLTLDGDAPSSSAEKLGYVPFSHTEVLDTTNRAASNGCT